MLPLLFLRRRETPCGYYCAESARALGRPRSSFNQATEANSATKGDYSYRRDQGTGCSGSLLFSVAVVAVVALMSWVGFIFIALITSVTLIASDGKCMRSCKVCLAELLSFTCFRPWRKSHRHGMRPFAPLVSRAPYIFLQLLGGAASLWASA